MRFCATEINPKTNAAEYRKSGDTLRYMGKGAAPDIGGHIEVMYDESVGYGRLAQNGDETGMGRVRATLCGRAG